MDERRRMNRLFCFGLGYTAGVLAQRLAAAGWKIAGTSTSEAGLAPLAAKGYDACLFDGKNPGANVAAALAGTTHVLVSAPPEANGDVALAHHAEDIAAADTIRWIGYLSTIGVYGDCDGAWIDETRELNPESERTRWRVEAEQAWLDLGRRTGKPVMIFRLPGIYGPGRSAVDHLRDGTARRIVKPGQVFNRMHVEDIASTLQASIAHPNGGAVYNLADDEPAPNHEIVEFAANLLGAPVPPAIPFESADLSPMAASFYASNRRVKNHRIKQELGVQLAYPTYREGLAAIAQHSP
jgi:nucleoside-diphosphate-sugar epimerase